MMTSRDYWLRHHEECAALRREHERAEAEARAAERLAAVTREREAAERAAADRERARREAEHQAERARLVARVHAEARALGIPEPAAREAGEALLLPPQLEALADRSVGWRVLWSGTRRGGLAPADATVEAIVQRYYTGK